MKSDRLNRFINNERTPDLRHYGLDPVRALLEHFGNPHASLRTIHIAGTNGKGSVAYMLHRIFSRAGYMTGLYTSPHLLELNERIRMGDELIPDNVFERYLDEIIDYADATSPMTPTYFDILTACAFRYFRDRRADIAIIETGLGGRLDSTNVVTPICSVITDISIDHAHILGKTLAAIAAEKAGIIKESVPVVTSNTGAGVMTVLAGAAASKRAPLLALGRDFSAENINPVNSGFTYDYSMPGEPRAAINRIELALPLRKQVNNSCCAITACIKARPLFPALSDDAVRDGLKTLVVPGRFQALSGKPLIIFDPAHNEAAIRVMMGLLRERHPGKEVTIVLTLMKDKDIPAIVSILAGSGYRIIYYIIDDPRCYRPPAGPASAPFKEIITSAGDALHRALDGLLSDNSLFFFTGTFRHYGAAIGYAGHCARSFPGFMPPP